MWTVAVVKPSLSKLEPRTMSPSLGADNLFFPDDAVRPHFEYAQLLPTMIGGDRSLVLPTP